MDSMDTFRERFDALEQRTEQLRQQTHTPGTSGALVAWYCLWGHRPGLGGHPPAIRKSAV